MLTFGCYTPLWSIAETVPNIMLLWCIFPRGDICLSNSLALYHLICSQIHFWFLYLSRCLWKSIGIPTSISTCTQWRTLSVSNPLAQLSFSRPTSGFLLAYCSGKVKTRGLKLWLATACSCFCFHLYVGTSENDRWDWQA